MSYPTAGDTDVLGELLDEVYVEAWASLYGTPDARTCAATGDYPLRFAVIPPSSLPAGTHVLFDVVQGNYGLYATNVREEN